MLVDSVLDKKGNDITLLDIRDQTVFADYFLICNGDNNRQLQALAEGIWEDAKRKGDTIGLGKEGEPESGWMLLDFGGLIVHLFSPEKRTYYKLEELWDKARIVLRVP